MSEKPESENEQAASSGLDDPPCSLLTSDIIKMLRSQAEEIRMENIAGWGNTMEIAANTLEKHTKGRQSHNPEHLDWGGLKLAINDAVWEKSPAPITPEQVEHAVCLSIGYLSQCFEANDKDQMRRGASPEVICIDWFERGFARHEPSEKRKSTVRSLALLRRSGIIILNFN